MVIHPGINQKGLIHVSLFSGGGGELLGSQWLKGWRTVCYVEYHRPAAENLIRRIKDGFLDDAPVWDDVRTFDGRPWAGNVDVVTGGFPCQPFSVAGRQLGIADPRNMWPDTIRIIREMQPRYVLLENVPGLLAGRKKRVKVQWVERSLFGKIRRSKEESIIFPSYFGRILADLAESGFDVGWRVLSAAEVGAAHKRDRIWIMANRTRQRKWRLPVR